MKTLYSWSVFVWILTQYLFWRAGLLRRRPEFTDRLEEVRLVVTQMFGWKRRVRIVNGEHCPRHNPALFVSNHHRLDDPIDLWPGVHWGSREGIVPCFVMRDDFFRGFPWNCLPFDLNHLCGMTGAVLISRDQLHLAQLRQMLGTLAKPGTLIMFPGRTRSRTGAWFEYRDEFSEPGSAAFVINHAQRRHPGLLVAAVPVARTWNPVRNTSAIVFGEPLHLAQEADRDAQRAMDCELLTRIGGLVEVHAVHLASLLLYLRTLHGGTDLPESFFVSAAEQWRSTPLHAYADPKLLADPAGEMAAALRHLAEKGAVKILNGVVTADAPRVLSSPAWEGNYRAHNPVKYWANQLIHLPAVIQWAESEVAGVGSQGAPSR